VCVVIEFHVPNR